MPMSRRAVTALLIALAAIPAWAVAATPASIRVPTRGFNLPGLFGPEPRPIADAVLDRLREVGFETIRLPVAPEMAAGEGFAARFSDILTTLIDRDFSVIVDMHLESDIGLDTDPATAFDLLEAAWHTLAGLIAVTPVDRVYLELLNEPPMTPKQWGKLSTRLATTVRAICPDHTLVWGPARVQGIWELDDVKPPADDNTIVAVHYYTPMGFTHQCEDWDESPLTRIANLPFPTTRKGPEVTALADRFEAAGDREGLRFLDAEFLGPWTAKRIENDFAGLAKWAAKHRRPVMLDEFGVLNFCVDPQSRANWVRAVRHATEMHDIGWTYWEVDQGFGFIADRQSPDGFDSTMIEALLA